MGIPWITENSSPFREKLNVSDSVSESFHLQINEQINVSISLVTDFFIC